MRQIGRYRLDAVHGSGSFATVWRGHDTALDVRVAVKVLADNWSHHADVRERFLEEARLLRRIESPRVVRVHDVGTDEDDRPYFVMDFAGGGSLDAVADGSLEPDVALGLAVEACRAVQVLHDAGVVHRDVKPANLLLADDGRVLAADLGSAKRVAEASGYTVTTGTPAYMAPEQARGEGISVRTDVYALAVLTCVLLTGALPSDPSRPLARTDPRTAVVLQRALSGDPARRHASAADLGADLEAVLTGEAAGQGRRWPTRWVAAAAVGAYAGSATGAYYLLT
ncbi:MAG: serine/threonine-protein kinase [Aeromicrobium erythreum]